MNRRAPAWQRWRLPVLRSGSYAVFIMITLTLLESLGGDAPPIGAVVMRADESALSAIRAKKLIQRKDAKRRPALDLDQMCEPLLRSQAERGSRVKTTPCLSAKTNRVGFDRRQSSCRDKFAHRANDSRFAQTRENHWARAERRAAFDAFRIGDGLCFGARKRPDRAPGRRRPDPAWTLASKTESMHLRQINSSPIYPPDSRVPQLRNP